MKLFPYINTKVEEKLNEVKITHSTWVRVFNKYEDCWMQLLVENYYIFSINETSNNMDLIKTLHIFIKECYNTIHLYKVIQNWDSLNKDRVVIKKCPLDLDERTRMIAIKAFEINPYLMQ